MLPTPTAGQGADGDGHADRSVTEITGTPAGWAAIPRFQNATHAAADTSASCCLL